jgi:hypothetical protein
MKGLATVVFGSCLSLILSSHIANAQVTIEDIRIQVFKERVGQFSDNLVGQRAALLNTPRGEGALGDPAEQVLVTLQFNGPRNTRSSDKIARDLANVTVTQTAKTGPRVLLKRAYGGFAFGDNGRYHKAFMLDNATCAPLEIDVRIGRSRRTTKLDFACQE